MTCGPWTPYLVVRPFNIPGEWFATNTRGGWEEELDSTALPGRFRRKGGGDRVVLRKEWLDAKLRASRPASGTAACNPCMRSSPEEEE